MDKLSKVKAEMSEAMYISLRECVAAAEIAGHDMTNFSSPSAEISINGIEYQIQVGIFSEKQFNIPNGDVRSLEDAVLKPLPPYPEK